MIKKCVLLSGLNDTRIFSTDFRKILKFKFNENMFSGNGRMGSKQTDGYDEANSCASQFRERTQECVNLLLLCHRKPIASLLLKLIR
jgi:hypothetical protein